MSARLSEAVAETARTETPTTLLRLADGLESGHITLRPTSGTLQARLGLPSSRLEPIHRVLASASDPTALAAVLRVAVATAERIRADVPRVEVAATQPHAVARIRTTGGVARDVINGCAEQLLVVGYSVTTDAALAGLAARTVAAMGAAAARGVVVTALLHRDETNRSAMLAAWTPSAPRPRFYTWPDQPGDAMAKMHAKVLVADKRDALVTSANLTYHGFVGNVEMGLRVSGAPAKTVADVFEQLMIDGHFVVWDE